MTNQNYQKGTRYERELVNEARKEGMIAFRSAGSHSPIDVCVIDKENRAIEFIQCKVTKKSNKKLKKDFEDSGVYKVEFILMER